MSEPAISRMSLSEFLRWDDGSETRYELLGGFPVAMAPPLEGHRIIAMRLAARIDAALASRRPCNAQTEAGVLHPERADTFFVVDLGVSCAPYQAGRQYLQDPILLVEIQSPSTERHDRRVKLPAYRRIASVEEILFLDSDARFAQLHHRNASGWLIDIVDGDGILNLHSIGIDIAVSELYDGIVPPADGGT
jgi:Uma2 family endonuclease